MKQFLLVAFLLAIATPAFACGEHETAAEHARHAMTHGGHDMSAMKMKDSPSTAAYQKSMMAMHKEMDIQYTGNADADFALGMIPHHKGAVEMARIELKYGTDPEMRKLAQDVIKAQETEIKFMSGWLKNHKAR